MKKPNGSSKAAYRKQVLEHLAAIRAAVERLANAADISNRVEPTSEWNHGELKSGGFAYSLQHIVDEIMQEQW